MTEDQTTDQEIELHDDENEIVEAQTHDPKNAEAQSVASVDKAGEATGSAPKRKGDNTKQDPMPKTKAGMMSAAVGAMQGMPKEKLSGVLSTLMQSTDADTFDGEAIAEAPELDYKADFQEDLNALVNEEATLSEEFKAKAETIFEAAIKSKLAEEIDRLEEKYNEELAEEVSTTKAELVEKVDSYLNYVVENWMDENKLAIQNGLRTEIAEKFMNSLKDLFTESYIEVPESKVDIVDELAETVDELEGQLNASIASKIEMQEELEYLSREHIIREHSTGLAETQIEKLKSLVEDADYDDWDSFSTKVLTIKESYFTKKVSESADIVEEDDDGTTPIHTSPAMEQYLNAIKKTQK
jgi:gas vesicle protein